MPPPLRETPLASVVAVAPVLTSAVRLRDSLWTHDPEGHAAHLDRYIPTQSGREALLGVLRGTHASTPQRVHFLTGSYGTGKSYLLLVLASVLGLRLDDERLGTLIRRLQTGEEVYKDGLAREIEHARDVETETKPGYGYLVVVPEYSDRQYDRAVLRALRDALDGAGLGDYRFPTEFAEAQAVLARWQSERPDLVAALRPHLDADGTSAERLARELADLDGEALERFGRYFEAVTGAPYRAERVSLEDTFAETSRHLQATGRYRGIAVLFDEFGFFLQEAASGRAGTAVAAVQTFMEFVRGRPGADLVLVLAAHRALADYGQGEGGEAEMKKMEGRLEATYRLRTSAEHREAETMMAGAFVRPDAVDDDARRAALGRLRETAEAEGWLGEASAWYPTAGAEWVQQTVVEGTYPLHPTATLALPGLSDDVGQNTRTMFRFLAPGEPGGAEAFIAASPVADGDGRLALLTLDRLFDYFVAPAEGGAGRGGAGAALAGYRAASAILRVDDPLADRVLKTVATITLFGDPRLQATPRTLRWALHLAPERQGELSDLLDVLVSQGALWQNQNTRIYTFRSVGGTAVDALLAEKRRAIGALAPDALLDFLRTTRAPTQYDPFEYNDRVKTNRRVASDYVVPGTEAVVVGRWREQFERLYAKGDSKGYEGNLAVLYGLYEDEGDRARLEAALKDASGAATFVGALAAAPVPLADLALDLAAATALLDDPKVKADDNAYNGAVTLVAEYQAKLAAALDRALDPARFAWFVDGERRHEPEALTARRLDRLLDEAVERTFPDTPVIASDVVQEYPSSNSTIHKRTREQAVDLMLGAVPFSMADTSAVDAVLKGLLKPNAMFEEQDMKANKPYGRVVAPPSGKPAAAVWTALEGRLLSQGKGRRETSIPDVLALLYRPPFGLSWTAAEVVLGAFVAARSDSFELRDPKGRQVPLSGETLLGACRSSKRNVLVHQAITGPERALLAALGEVLARRKVAPLETSFGPWADPAARFAEWYGALPELTKKGARDEDEDVAAVFDALDGYRGTRDDHPARALFVETLPTAFDLAVLDDPDDLAAFAKRLEAAVKDADRFAERYAEALFNDVTHAAFEQPCTGPREFGETVDAWVKGLPPAAKQHRYDGPADALIRAATRGATDDVADRYFTALAREWSMVPFRGWKTKKQRAEYVSTFRNAVREVRAWKASPLPDLDRLHRQVFGGGAESEAQVDASFRAWLDGLPDATFARLEGGAFGPTASALFVAIQGSGTVEERYLGALPAAMPQVMGTWPSWPPVSVNVFVQDVAEAVQTVQAWTPPLSADATAAALLDRLGWPADPGGGAAADALDAAAAAWYDGLTAPARLHPFDGLAGGVVRRLSERAGLAAGLADELPRLAGLPPLHEAPDAASAERLLDQIAEAVAEVEAWRRPTLDVLRLAAAELGVGPLEEASALTLRLGEWAGSLCPAPDGQDGAAGALLAWARSGSGWQPAFAAFAEASGLPADVHEWRPADDVAFAEAFAAARAEVEAWTPPPTDPATLRAAVTDALRDVLRETRASRSELMAVLFDAAADVRTDDP